jgi:hypothetical protein
MLGSSIRSRSSSSLISLLPTRTTPHRLWTANPTERILPYYYQKAPTGYGLHLTSFGLYPYHIVGKKAFSKSSSIQESILSKQSFDNCLCPTLRLTDFIQKQKRQLSKLLFNEIIDRFRCNLLSLWFCQAWGGWASRDWRTTDFRITWHYGWKGWHWLSILLWTSPTHVSRNHEFWQIIVSIRTENTHKTKLIRIEGTRKRKISCKGWWCYEILKYCVPFITNC